MTANIRIANSEFYLAVSQDTSMFILHRTGAQQYMHLCSLRGMHTVDGWKRELTSAVAQLSGKKRERAAALKNYITLLQGTL